MRRAKITGTGMCVPSRVVSNDDLAQLMDTSDEWIRQRSGIATRHYIEPGQKPSELAQIASTRALEAAGLEPGDVDLVILATLSAEADFPGTSFFLHERLGLGEKGPGPVRQREFCVGAVPHCLSRQYVEHRKALDVARMVKRHAVRHSAAASSM